MTLLLLVCAIYMGAILCTQPIYGELHVQCNADREIATVSNSIEEIILEVLLSNNQGSHVVLKVLKFKIDF